MDGLGDGFSFSFVDMNENNNSPVLNQDYWSNRWEQGQTGWDMGHASPALIRFVQNVVPKTASILIPGAGNGHEAEWLFKNGWENVHVVDIAAQPLANLQERVPELPADQLIHADFFAHQGQYDLILEQTFFCALNPGLRPAYAEHMHSLLKQDGILAGLLFNFPLTEKGPPFGGSEAEYRGHFAPYFEMEEMAVSPDSIKPRAGAELFFVARRIAD